MRSPSSSRLPLALPDAPVRTRAYAGPFIILVGIVFASAIQTEVANHLAQKLGFNKPYFSFFVTHVAFSFVFPVHLAVLSLRRGPHGAGTRAKQLLRNLRAVLADQLGTAPRWRRLARPLTNKIVPLTMLISFPAICWYVAMALSPAMDITAIYATSAFHTYFFSLLLLGTRLTKVTVAAIAVAFAGVLVITFDDAGKADDGKTEGPSGRSRMIGDIIMVVGAMGLGLYEVVYKMVLPESEGGAHRAGGEHAISPTVAVFVPGVSPPHQLSPPLPPVAVEDEDDDAQIALGNPAGSRTPLLAKNGSRSVTPTPLHAVPQLPAAFHSNFLTSALGFATLVLLWLPFPFLHWSAVEVFVWPSGGRVWASLMIAASMGAIYNAGLMTLIGIWGPTVASVANLLTIALVGIADAIWMGSAPSIIKIAGAGLICAGFAVLLWEGDEA